jgi:hypothetical protein
LKLLKKWTALMILFLLAAAHLLSQKLTRCEKKIRTL